MWECVIFFTGGLIRRPREVEQKQQRIKIPHAVLESLSFKTEQSSCFLSTGPSGSVTHRETAGPTLADSFPSGSLPRSMN